MQELTKEQIESAKLAWSDLADNGGVLDSEMVIKTIAPYVQYAPTTGALTDEQWAIISNFNPGVSLGCQWRLAIEAVLFPDSSRTAPQPAAEPSNEPSNELIQLRELMRQLVDTDRSFDPETGEDTTLERVRYLCQTLVPDSIYPPPSMCGVCGKELVFTVGPHNEGDTLITSDCRHSFRSNKKKAEPSPAPVNAPVVPEGMTLIYNELLANLYIRLSGKERHCSDCATSVAPAETPGPCDCDAPVDAPRSAPFADGYKEGHDDATQQLLAHPPAEWLEKRDAEWAQAVIAEKLGTDFTVEMLKRCRARLKTAEKTPEERVSAIILKHANTEGTSAPTSSPRPVAPSARRW